MEITWAGARCGARAHGLRCLVRSRVGVAHFAPMLLFEDALPPRLLRRGLLEAFLERLEHLIALVELHADKLLLSQFSAAIRGRDVTSVGAMSAGDGLVVASDAKAAAWEGGAPKASTHRPSNTISFQPANASIRRARARPAAAVWPTRRLSSAF